MSNLYFMGPAEIREGQRTPATGKGSAKQTRTLVEVVGLKDSACSPFPCDEARSCGLYACFPSGTLVRATAALKEELIEAYGDSVEVQLKLIDDNVPAHIEEIIRQELPPVPFILINGKLVPVGRISLPRIRQEIDILL